MPKTASRSFPKYSLHSASGQARVRIAGKDHYLGEYGSPASKALYEEMKQQWHLSRGEVSKWTCTIDDLAIRFPMERLPGRVIGPAIPRSLLPR